MQALRGGCNFRPITLAYRAASGTPDIPPVELVYFDIHARGELVRLCYAAHVARGGQQRYLDTRLPFFMDSEANQQLCDQVHRPAAPFQFFPYLNVHDEATGRSQAISGDGVIEGYVARRLGLLGANGVQAAVCLSVASAALSPCSPPLTGAGLRGDSDWVVNSVQPSGVIGTPLAQLERYVRSYSADGYIVGGSPTVADLAVFNVLDESVLARATR